MAHNYCRSNVKDYDKGYRTPQSGYWKKFKEAYYIMEAEHTEMERMTKDQASLNVIAKLRNFPVTSSIRRTYDAIIKEFEAKAKEERAEFQTAELYAIAEQEQVNVLQPLIYNDPLLKETMDTNHRFSRLTGGWIAPKLKVIFAFSQKNSDPELEAVFDAPKGLVDQFSGTLKSLPNQDDRMVFVGQIAKKFNLLMSTKSSYMESELRKIANWAKT